MTGEGEVREEVVAALLLGRDRGEATGTERALARDAAATAARLWQDESLLPTGRKIEDATLREITGIAAAYGELACWWPQRAYEGKKLSDVLKVVPEDVAETVRFWLTWAGHMSDPDARLRRLGVLRLGEEDDGAGA